MGIRTDLAVERLELAEKSLPHGAIRSEETIHGIPMVTVQVEDTNAAEVLGKPIGKYLTVECTPFRKTPENFEAEVMAVAEAVSRLLPRLSVAPGSTTPTSCGISSRLTKSEPPTSSPATIPIVSRSQ